MTPVLEKSPPSPHLQSIESTTADASLEEDGRLPESESPTAPPAKAALRLAIWAGCIVAAIGGTTVWLLLIRDGGLLEHRGALQSGWLALGGICLGFWLLLKTTPTYAIRLSPRLSKRLILGLTLVPIAAAILWTAPLLSVEPLQHRLDARSWLLGGTPHGPLTVDRPRQFSREPELQPDVLDLAASGAPQTMPHLPVAQAAAVTARALEYQFSPALTSDRRVIPGTPTIDWRGVLADAPPTSRLLFWRLLLGCILLLTTGELIAWLRMHDRSPWWAVCFAWHPLVLIETVGMGHEAIIGVLFLVAGLRRIDGHRYRRAGLCLAAAAMVKPIALLALPFALRSSLGRRDKPLPAIRQEATSAASLRRFGVWFLATLTILSMPLWLPGWGGGLARLVPQSLLGSEQSSSLYRVLGELFLGDAPTPSRLFRVRVAVWVIAGLAMAIAGSIAWARKARPITAFYVLSLTGLLFSPISPPWMILWPLAAVPLSGGRFGLTALVWATTAVLLYDARWLTDNTSSAASAWLAYSPTVAAALVEVIAGFIRRNLRRDAVVVA